MPRMIAALATIAAAGIGAPSLSASPDVGDVDLAAERAAIGQFQDLDQRLQDIGWKLVTGNAAFCPESLPAIGLQLQDMASYGRPDIARAALGLERDFAVQTAAEGSPAGAIGTVARNVEIVRLERFDPNAWEAGDRLYWQRLTRAHDHIDAMLAEHGGIEIGLANGDSVRLIPVEACATRFELAGDGGRAVADGNRVVIGAAFPGFALDEELFAAAVAHELAHNFLKHSEWLDRNGRSRKNIRATEREADRLMPWLLANAGYDPAAAARFFAEYRPSSGSVLFIPGSHPKWQDRMEAVEAEIPVIRRLMAADGEADWSAHFRREIDPQERR
ncbi:hypothetical protein ACI5KX_01335 [Erythrobacter sp. GH1-10]|uniref:hypothetical protein n=1 Tax=Erythrobacter sp. GH1-10 TaxID=3349334 RepID=UPI0038779CF3